MEDPLDEDDWDSWQAFTRKIDERTLQLVGDDFFATNAQRLASGIERQVANAVLIKVNQNGTLSGTLEVMALARKSGYATVVSARSGETEDSFIADLAVATGQGRSRSGRCAIRSGSPNTISCCVSRREASLPLAAFMRGVEEIYKPRSHPM